MRKAHPRASFCSCLIALAACLVWQAQPTTAQSDQSKAVDAPAFHEYDPPSTLIVPATELKAAKFPFVDVHNHQWQMPDADMAAVAREMDALNMAVMVNLSGRGFTRAKNADGSFRLAYQERGFLKRAIDNGEKHASGRFLVFSNLDTTGLGEPGWRQRTLDMLRQDAANGAAGLKIYKGLGLDQVDVDGRRIAVDDERLAPVWQLCGELRLPVLIHTGEPASFWLPKDGSNERLLEMMEKPERWRGEPGAFPAFEDLLAEQHRLFERHPETIFINAHFGWLANDLARLGRLLDRFPNVYVEFGAVIAELGRQPRFGRRFMVEHQDRVLFGKDTWRPEEYSLYFRVLETDDDYIKYFRPRHAFWRLYGLALPDSVLRKIYYENALRIFPQIDRSRFPG